MTPSTWADRHADFYAQTIAMSSYAFALVPLLRGPFDDLLDIGAGSGELTRRCLSRGARWCAVEPNAAMQSRLAAQRSSLARSEVTLHVEPTTWQRLAPELRAQTVLAANLGATHQEAGRFHDAMRPRFAREMVWVVPAQAGPSTFCLAGFLPPELHGADTRPAFERTLEQLGGTRAPDDMRFADWTYRATFANPASAERHFLDRIGLAADSPKGLAVSTFVARHADVHREGVTVSCSKRSAVLRWRADATG